MCKLNIFDKLSFLLVFIGSITWGTIGLFDLNIINLFSLNNPLVERIIYILILLSALDLITLFFRGNSIGNND